MNADAIQLFSLIGLRALVEYDSPEYRRVTDLSRSELETKILELRESLSTHEDPLLHEIDSRLAELKLIQGESRSHIELSFLLKQLSNSCLQRAQQLALLHGRTTRRDEFKPVAQRLNETERAEPQARVEEEFVQLAAMRLLRRMPGYSAQFNVRLKDVEIDSILRPDDSRLPVVFIEAKRYVRNDEVLKRAAAQLKRAVSGWGKGALQVILTTAVDPSIRGLVDARIAPAHLLVYDQEANEFVQNYGGEGLVAAISKARDHLS